MPRRNPLPTADDNPRATTRRPSQLDPERSRGANPDDSGMADLNKIMATYRRTGTLPRVASRTPLYGDFTGPQDLADAMEAVEAAKDRFNDLPSQVRSAAGNDPVNFLAMFSDPDGRKLLIKHGLVIEERENPLPTQNASNDTGPLTPGSAPDEPTTPVATPEPAAAADPPPETP